MSHRELILGGPGCGKTTKLLSLVQKHLADGVHPNEVAFVAFTRKAAIEAKQRAINLFGLGDDDLPYFKTLHSFAFRELNIGHEQLMTSDHYTELGDILKIKFGGVDDELGIMSEQRERGSQYYYIEQQARLRCIELKNMCLVDGRQGYIYVNHYREALNLYKRKRQLLDYTDILEVWHDKLRSLPIKILIVDEAQDLSALQWKLIHKMERDVPYVYYAGDDDQAIYHWAGADIKHFLGLRAHRTILPVSYRLPVSVFNRCERIAQRIRVRYQKHWKPTEREGRVSLVSSPELAPLESGEWMILARSHYQLDEIAQHLKVKGHAYTHKGRSSLATTDGLAVRGWLRAQESEYVSIADLKHIIAKYPRSLLKVPAKGLFEMEEDSSIPKELILDEYGINLALHWYEGLSLRPSEKIYYQLVLKKEGSLENTPRLQVSTIHSVKGGECDNVLLLPDISSAAYESFIKDSDSEARVFYVGASRAKEQLVLCQPQSANYFPL